MTGKDGRRAGQSGRPLPFALCSLVKDSGKHGHPTAWVEFHGRSLSTRLRKPGRELRLKEAFHLVDRDKDGVLSSGPFQRIEAPDALWVCCVLLAKAVSSLESGRSARAHVAATRPTVLLSTSPQGSDTSSESALPRQASFAVFVPGPSDQLGVERSLFATCSSRPGRFARLRESRGPRSLQTRRRLSIVRMLRSAGRHPAGTAPLSHSRGTDFSPGHWWTASSWCLKHAASSIHTCIYYKGFSRMKSTKHKSLQSCSLVLAFTHCAL